MAIDRKINHYSLNNPASIYNEEALTSLELSARTAGLVNECVDEFNKLEENTVNHLTEQDEFIDKMNEETMPALVDKEVNDHITKGDFDKQIERHIGNLEDRVDNLLGKVVEGSTTMDAEVIDARVDDEGKTFINLGEAIRMPLKKVKSKFSYATNKFNPIDCEDGYYINKDGNKINSVDYVTTDFIECADLETMYSVGVAHITLYDENKGFISGVVSPTYLQAFDVTGASYIRVSMAKICFDYAYIGEKALYHPLIQCVENTALDENQFKRKDFVESLIDNKFLIFPEWQQIGFDANGNYVEGTNPHISSKFSVDGAIKTFYVQTKDDTKPLFIIGFDGSGNKIYSNYGWDTFIEVPNNCAYYMLDQNVGSSLLTDYIGSTVDIWFNLLEYTSLKKPYAGGFINFTVPVNQKTVPAFNYDNSVIDSESFVDVNCILKLPTSYSASGTPTKLLMMCHGAGRGVYGEDDSWSSTQSYINMVDGLVGAGFAVFDSNGYGNDELGYNFWGAPRGLEAYRKAYEYVVANYNVTSDLCIYGFSMGGLTALNLVLQGFPNVKAVGVGSPVMDLTLMNPQTSTAFSEAYELDGVYDEKKVKPYDPYARIRVIDDKSYIFANIPPLKMWYGSTETTGSLNVSLAENFIRALQNNGSPAYLNVIQNAGHEICYGANANVNKELVTWFKRFM